MQVTLLKWQLIAIRVYPFLEKHIICRFWQDRETKFKFLGHFQLEEMKACIRYTQKHV